MKQLRLPSGVPGNVPDKADFDVTTKRCLGPVSLEGADGISTFNCTGLIKCRIGNDALACTSRRYTSGVFSRSRIERENNAERAGTANELVGPTDARSGDECTGMTISCRRSCCTIIHGAKTDLVRRELRTTVTRCTLIISCAHRAVCETSTACDTRGTVTGTRGTESASAAGNSPATVVRQDRSPAGHGVRGRIGRSTGVHDKSCRDRLNLSARESEQGRSTHTASVIRDGCLNLRSSPVLLGRRSEGAVAILAVRGIKRRSIHRRRNAGGAIAGATCRAHRAGSRTGTAVVARSDSRTALDSRSCRTGGGTSGSTRSAGPEISRTSVAETACTVSVVNAGVLGGEQHVDASSTHALLPNRTGRVASRTGGLTSPSDTARTSSALLDLTAECSIRTRFAGVGLLVALEAEAAPIASVALLTVECSGRSRATVNRRSETDVSGETLRGAGLKNAFATLALSRIALRWGGAVSTVGTADAGIAGTNSGQALRAAGAGQVILEFESASREHHSQREHVQREHRSHRLLLFTRIGYRSDFQIEIGKTNIYYFTNLKERTKLKRLGSSPNKIRARIWPFLRLFNQINNS